MAHNATSVRLLDACKRADELFLPVAFQASEAHDLAAVE
jgi:hypothetical protein